MQVWRCRSITDQAQVFLRSSACCVNVEVYWVVQVGLLTPLTFAGASLKSLGCFYLWCVLSSQWKAVTVNFTLPTLKAFLEAHSQNVTGNKQ